MRSLRRSSGYVSSMVSFLPTAAAARSSVESVTDRFAGSSRRSTAGRLVFMRCAISDLVNRARFISWAIWKAITRLAAVASASSRRRSSRRNSSKSPPRCCFFITSLLIKPGQALLSCLEVRCRHLLRLLDEAVQQDHHASIHGEDHPCNAAADMRPDLPHARLQLPDERHPQRPSIPVSYTHLRAHETDSYLVCRLLLEKKKKKQKIKKKKKK